jgi:UDP-N-acetylmuramyl pentapeptide phosphotransferase/UDP-N-acetylglucosamine-1-phosphate transferase
MQANGTSTVGLIAAFVLAGVALHYFRRDRARGRVFASLACALGFSYLARSTGTALLEWLSWAFLALGLGFLVWNRRTRAQPHDPGA